MSEEQGQSTVNSDALADLIATCATEMNAIKKARQELNEEAGDIRERLRDAGVSISAFNFAMKLQEMEPQAQDAYMQSLSEAHKALHIGGQLDWVSAGRSFDLQHEHDTSSEIEEVEE